MPEADPASRISGRFQQYLVAKSHNGFVAIVREM